LRQAIQSLKPAGAFDPNDATWRYYTILHEQYERRRMPDAVMDMLVVEKSQYFSLQARALAELGHVLAGWEQAQTQAQVDAAEPQSGPMPIFMAPAMNGKIFLGREALLGQMAAHLLQGRSVAMHGLPGVGKSTFAAALAHRPDVRQGFPDGVLWAGLGQGSDPFAWLGEWAAALGLPRAELAYLTTLEARVNAVHTAISMRRMLLVIDDAWTSDPSTDSGALALRVGGPNCAHLLTTRLASVAADFAGPNAFGLPELDEANGLAVLIEHAPALAHTPQVATELARVVGNLPLALTLMGRYAHKATRGSPRRLQAALDALHQAKARLALAQPAGPLNPDGNGIDASQRSLQAAIGLSDAALDDSAQRAFYALSVFPPKPNTFSEEAALAVTGEPPEALDALVDAGLLEVADGRYTLHPVMVDYALITHPPDGEIKNRFTVFFVDFLTLHHGGSETFDAEYSNFYMALLTGLNGARQRTCATLVNAIFDYFESRGLYDDARRLLQLASQILDSSGDICSAAEAQLNLGRVSVKLGSFGSARLNFEEGLRLAIPTNDLQLTGALLKHLGSLENDFANYERALEHYNRALALAIQRSDHLEISNIKLHMGVMEEQLGNYSCAQSHFANGMEIARREGDLVNQSALLINMAILEAKRGRQVKAIVLLRQGLTIARRIGHKEMICLALVMQGLGLVTLRLFKLAEPQIRDALGISKAINHQRLMIMSTTTYGILETLREDYKAAEKHYDEALTLARRILHPYDLCFVLNAKGSHCSLQRRWDETIQILGESMTLSSKFRLKELWAISAYHYAKAVFAKGDRNTARQLAKQSLGVLRELDPHYWAAHEVVRWLRQIKT
jgi:tetratricopeptide (TPR) repeat protein